MLGLAIGFGEFYGISKNDPLIVAKLCKLLMMAKNNIGSMDKLVHVKWEFGFPNDLLENLVSRSGLF